MRQRIYTRTDDTVANERTIYGSLLSKVEFIRRRGWVVFKEGNEYRVGTKLLNEQGVIDVYNREAERELREHPPVAVVSKRPKGKKPPRHGGGVRVPKRSPHGSNRNRG